MEKLNEKHARHEDRTARLEQQVLQLQEAVMMGAEGHITKGSYFGAKGFSEVERRKTCVWLVID